MASPLARYVTLTYAKYFVVLLVPFALVALPVEMNLQIGYVMILPLAAVDVMAFAGALLLLSQRRTRNVAGVWRSGTLGREPARLCDVRSVGGVLGRDHSTVQQRRERATVRGDWTNRDNLHPARRRSPMLETILRSVLLLHERQFRLGRLQA